MNVTELTRVAMKIPLLGPRVEKFLLDQYNPLRRLKVFEHTGPHGERMFFEQLALTRNASDWCFKVYTSKEAQDTLGIVTTIWLRRSALSSHPRQNEIELEFARQRRYYAEYMQSNFQEEAWKDIANGRSFDLNSRGWVAKDGVEITIAEYERDRDNGIKDS